MLTALAAPAQAVTLRIVDATLEVGGAPQMVTFAVDDATGVEGFELALSYDPAVVRIAGAVRRTAIAEGCLLVDNPNEPGTLRIALACLSPLEGAGGVLTIPLAARAPGTSPFVITYCRVNEQVSEGHPVGVVTVLDRDALATTVASPRSPDH
ncbi:MAG: cohesin domain-containing protein [Candidatus Binatia bacterium]